MKLLQELHNTLLKRHEIIVVMETASNPGFEKAKTLLAEKFKAKEDVIAVKAVRSHFGRRTFVIEAYIYSSPADKLRIEQKPKVKKKNPAEAK